MLWDWMVVLVARAYKLKLRPKPELTIVLEDLDFTWYQHEVNQVAELWQRGANIVDIAEQVRPAVSTLRKKQDAVDEVVLLIMHLSRQGRIRPRPGGIFGGVLSGRG